jgi:hypothetical protein
MDLTPRFPPRHPIVDVIGCALEARDCAIRAQHYPELLEEAIMQSSEAHTIVPAPAQQSFPETMLRWFVYAHLPEKLRSVSEPFGVLAQRIVDTLPQCAERTVALRKLLEAKDAAVRAALWNPEP